MPVNTTPGSPQPELNNIQQRVFELAQADLTTHVSGSVPAIRIIRFEDAEWRGRNLGCNDPAATLSTVRVPGFRLLLLAGDTIYTYHADETRVRLCEQVSILQAPPDILIEIDPVAAELVDLALRRLARDLDISTRRVQLVEIEPMVWEDSSLGCPVEGQTYVPANSIGYRIVLSAGEQVYVFHTAFDRIILCDEL